MPTVALLASLLATLPQEPPVFEFESQWREVAAVMRAECDKNDVVGGSLMFVKGNSVLGVEHYGFADRSGKRPVDLDTIFHWASITKTLTGIAIMQLRDREKLRLDQPIVDLVPELQVVRQPYGEIKDITFAHLLSHSAGFRGATWPWAGKSWHPHEPTEWSQLVAMMPYTEIEFLPGSRYSYSNPGVVFLGRAIEKLSGDDFEVYMQKNVLTPLGMHRSYYDITPYHLQKYRSHSYERSGREMRDLGPDFDTGITVSNGGLNAPLPDMARYLAFLLGATESGSDAAGVLSRESLTSMWKPILPTSSRGGEHIALTFFVQEHGGQPFVTHTGGQRSFVTFFYVHPLSGTGALGAFNTSTSGPVMAKIRTACMKRLSLPLAQKSQ